MLNSEEKILTDGAPPTRFASKTLESIDYEIDARSTRIGGIHLSSLKGLEWKRKLID